MRPRFLRYVPHLSTSLRKEIDMSKLTKADVNRIKSGQAKSHDGKIDKGSFPAKAESIVAKRGPNKGGNK